MGTPFDLPANASPPPALELDETIKEQIVYLALPLRQPGLVEAGGANATDATLRYRSRTEEVRAQRLRTHRAGADSGVPGE